MIGVCVHAVETLSCSVAQPVCNGKKANAQKKTVAATNAPKLGEKSTPTNAATSSATSGATSGSSNSTSSAISPSALSASSALYVAALTVVLAAVVV